MKRRTFLAATTAGTVTPLVGCLDGDGGGGGDGGDGDGGTDPGADPTDTEDDESSLEIVGVEGDSAPGLPVDPTVSVVTASATADAPASVRVTWENVGSETVGLGEARSVVFATAVSEDGRAHLIDGSRLGNRDDFVAFDDCWRLTDPIAVDGAYETAVLDPGEVHESELELYADEDCLDDDTYRFETTVSLDDPEEPSGDGDAAEWGFELTVQRSE